MRLKLHVIPVTQLFDEKARQMPVALSSVSWNKDSGLGIQDKMPFREIRLLRPRENGKISRHSTFHAALSQCRRTSRNPQWRKTRCDQAPASQEFSARQILSLHCFTSPKGCCLLHANTTFLNPDGEATLLVRSGRWRDLGTPLQGRPCRGARASRRA